MHLLELDVELITRNVGELEVKEDEIEILLLSLSDRFGTGADNNATETGFLKILLKQRLERRVIIDDEDGRLSSFFVAEHVSVEKATLDAPTATDLDGGELASLNEIVDGWQRDTEIIGCLLYRHQFGWFLFRHGLIRWVV